MDAITYAMSKKYTDSKVTESGGLHREIVNSLPSTGDNNIIYMVLDPNASSPDVYDEWLWINGTYEHIGSTRVDLTDYYNKTQVDAALSGKANTATTLSGYGITDAYTKTEIDTALSNKANTSDIPTALSGLSDDSTHRVVTDIEKSTWNGKSNFSGSYNDLSNKPTIPVQLSDLTDDATHRLVTDTEKTAWNGKANSATTLAGYGITDAYTKTEVDTALGNRLEIQNNAGFHNSVYRGKSLGSSVTPAQQQAIHNGTFEDLFIGDYWTINDINYRIAEFDYWLHGGKDECTSHHVVLVPDSVLYTARMNSTNTTDGAYVCSEMRGGTYPLSESTFGVSAGNLTQARTIITNAFGTSSLLVHKENLSTDTVDGYVAEMFWGDSDIELMNELMVYGEHLLAPATNGGETNTVANYELSKTQLALFRYNTSAIMCTRSSWWLRDAITTKQFAKVNIYGNASGVQASSSATGVRPCFAITY